MTEQDIISKATTLRSQLNEGLSWEAITNLHPNYASVKADIVESKQLGDSIRTSYVFVADGFLNRILVGGEPNGKYEVIEECRLEKVKPTITETKVTLTGETQVFSNDVEKIVKEDTTAKEVIEDIKREVKELAESVPVSVKITEFDKKTEYVVNLEIAPT